MCKIWYVLINGIHEGPWSFEELKKDNRLTPDTLVWKEGFQCWKKIRDVPELDKLFEEEVESPNTDEEPSDIGEKKPVPSVLVLDMGQEPPYIVWILIALVSLAYVLLRIYVK